SDKTVLCRVFARIVDLEKFRSNIIHAHYIAMQHSLLERKIRIEAGEERSEMTIESWIEETVSMINQGINVKRKTIGLPEESAQPRLQSSSSSDSNDQAEAFRALELDPKTCKDMEAQERWNTIKGQFRHLALEHHPDKKRNPEEAEATNEKFISIRSAFQLLSDKYNPSASQE
ncbi:hypothetical protein E3V59_02985, partial [Streptococcus pseudopneumoniae]|uniref:DnaJ domain-containing protein n=1 Tax=Streptococcus pseudopneumoniae TaxID=257758 RepID=UPI00110C31BB